MLSFFSKKKPSPPDTPPEEVIQGPTDPQQNNNGDDFIFVEKKTPEEPPAPIGMYPPMPVAPWAGGMHMGGGIHGGIGGPQYAGTHVSNAPLPYMHGVPFEMAPQLCTKSEFETTQLQVDGILAWLTRQLSVDEQDEYNFRLERSIQNECY